MKQKIFISVFLLNTLFATAQIYVGSTGAVSIGSTSAAVTTVQSFGNTLFCPVVSSISSAPYIASTSAYGTKAAPEYSFYNDGQTGMYHPASDSLNFTIGGGELLALGNNQISSWCSGTYSQNFISHLPNTSSATTWVVKHGSSSNFYVYGGGQEWAYSNNILSDARIKQNINTITNALSKVLQLRGVTFTYIRDSNNAKTQMGLIAQEVQKVVPEVVNMGLDSLYGVQYQNLIGLLIEAIKTQNQSIDSLRTILNDCCNSSNERGALKKSSDSATGASSTVNNPSLQAALSQNIPNPWSQTTTISCYIPAGSNSASILIFDMAGVLKKTLPINGTEQQSIVISGGQLTAGMYMYTLIIDNKEIDTKKMILTQ